MMFDGWMGGGWPFGGLLGLAVLGLAIYGLGYLVRTRVPEGSVDVGAGSVALKMLDERYAKSEIDRDEYLRRKRDILGKGGQ